jgi:hypothetical protein
MKTPILILSLAALLTASAQYQITESPVQLEPALNTITAQGLDEMIFIRSVTKQDVDDVVWALKAAMRQFRPPLKEGEWEFNGAIYSVGGGPEEDTSSPEYFRRQAKEMEEKAKDAERRDADIKRARAILAKWENAQKEMGK